MAAKKPQVVVAPPVVAVPVVVHDGWMRSILTDHQGEFDTGRILTPIVVVGMLGLAVLDTWKNGAHFDAQAFGIGIGAVLAGLAAYLWGDTKRPDPSVTTSVQMSKTTTS